MADQKISQLTDGTSFQAGDEAVVNRSGTNYKVDPTQFGSSIDVTGTVTADGLTVDGDATIQGDKNETLQLKSTNTSTVGWAGSSSDRSIGRIEWYGSSPAGNGAGIKAVIDTEATSNTGRDFDLLIKNSNNVGSGEPTLSLRIDASKDISFYEDTGTTPKFFWDASAERLGIGTTTPDTKLDLFLGTTTSGDYITTGNTNRFGNGLSKLITFKHGYNSPQEVAAIAVNTTSNAPNVDGRGDLLFYTGTSGASDGGSTSAERMRIDFNGNVGIGTSSPSTLLHLESIDPRITLTDTTLAGNCNHVIRGADQFLLISADDGNTQGTSSLRFNVDGSEAARIDFNGNLLVGKTTTYGDEIAAFYESADASRYLYVENPNAGTSATAIINANAGAGGDLRMAAYGTNHSTQANNASLFNHKLTGSLLLGTNGTERLRIDASGNLLVGTTTSPSDTGTVVADGIYLGGTGAANLLDDYEEGTFTPTITGSTTAGTGTYSTQSGRYIRIGNKVTVVGYIGWTAHTGVGNMRISNLPFTSLNVADLYSPASFSFLRFLTLPASSVMTGDLPPNSTDIVLRTYTLGTANPTDLVLDTNAQMMFSLTYPAS
jgi:hypothetical protein